MSRRLVLAIGISALAVCVMTVIDRVFFVDALFWALFPGSLTTLLITGPHGGTVNQERLALVVELAVNTFFYFCLVWIVARPVRNTGDL